MTYFFNKAKNEIVKTVNGAIKKNIVKAADLVTPVNADFGDLSLSCFNIGKVIGKTPVETAGLIVGRIKTNGVLAGAQAVGPYVNFTLNKNKASKSVFVETANLKNKYGENKSGKGKKIMIEYSNANTHKEYHVGHLRNLCFGDAVNRIIDANGFKSLPVSYINDFGIHVAKTLWAYLEYYKNAKPPENKGYFLGRVYARASQEMAKEKLAKEKVSFIMKKIESRKGEEYKLWQTTRRWSIEQFDKIYKELGIKFFHIFYESDFIDEGKDLASKLYARRFLIKSENAIIADLNDYNLNILMFFRTDGTALYPVADLPLAIAKFKKYKIDKSLYVVDFRQSLYFKQLFKVLELLGYKKPMAHLAYDFVKLPSGMMSSRTGNVITYEDLRDELLAKAVAETKKRHEDWDEKKINKVARILTNGAIKFEMIKVGASQVITFDINQALQFEGYTAAYLQYTCARINSILKKSKAKHEHLGQKSKTEVKNQNFENERNIESVKEHVLIMKLAKFPEAVVKAGETYDPSVIAKYVFDLARGFNDYYHSVPVLQAETKLRDARLKLIASVKQVVANGLSLLGIDTVDEM